ncbi:hypothetical protein PG991_016291 [Apiospora marii]|uniref:Methyltransferase domain-containing protein n=1 Tax=Apiospora marii TaxID=335849 RepID=A0ABR1QZX3_9PEZI
MSHNPQPIKTEQGGDESSGGSASHQVPASAAAVGAAQLPEVERMTPWTAQDLLPEDYPVIDPFYQRSDLVSPVALPPSQSGLPPEAWMPGEWHRESSGSSVVEPNSVTEDNGRTYHGYKEGRYFAPNDAVQQDRLDMGHYATTVMMSNRLYLAPIQSPKRVLDLATGTGIWAMDFAREHPDCEVIGTDLSKIQPEHPPGNVQFIRDDAEDTWEFGPPKFDYIHARHVMSCFDQPKAVMAQAFGNLEPGGWVEYHDTTVDVLSMDGSTRGTTLEEWGRLIMAGAAASGRDVRVSMHYKEWLEEVGFVDVVERKMAGPLGPWPQSARLKETGRVTQRIFYDNVNGMSYKLFRALGYTQEQIDEFADRFRVDLLSPAIHAYFPV